MSDPYDIRYYPDRERIKELEADNAKLTAIIDDLRHQLAGEREKVKSMSSVVAHVRAARDSKTRLDRECNFDCAIDAAKEPAGQPS
jgi:uncharacterized coiled-coil protein SlyX